MPATAVLDPPGEGEAAAGDEGKALAGGDPVGAGVVGEASGGDDPGDDAGAAAVHAAIRAVSRATGRAVDGWFGRIRMAMSPIVGRRP